MGDPVVDEEGDAGVGDQIERFFGRRVCRHYYYGGRVEGRRG